MWMIFWDVDKRWEAFVELYRNISVYVDSERFKVFLQVVYGIKFEGIGIYFEIYAVNLRQFQRVDGYKVCRTAKESLVLVCGIILGSCEEVKIVFF